MSSESVTWLQNRCDLSAYRVSGILSRLHNWFLHNVTCVSSHLKLETTEWSVQIREAWLLCSEHIDEFSYWTLKTTKLVMKMMSSQNDDGIATSFVTYVV